MTAYAHGAALVTAAWLESGASVELIDGVDVAYADELFARREITAVFAPPTVLAKLVDGTRHTRIEGIKCIFCGTATLQPALYRAAAALFGPVIRVTYGKSEMYNPITVLEMDEAADYYRDLEVLDAVCLGSPAAGVEIVIRDEAGRVCGAGEHGEIHLRSPHMMIGHVDAQGFHELPEGAFHATGDLGYRDARGRLFLAGRANDVIKTGGYKIYPEEIERVLPGGVAVVGIPSAHWGEVIVAVSEDGELATDSREGHRGPCALQAAARLPHARKAAAQPAGQGAARAHARDGARSLYDDRWPLSEVRPAESARTKSCSRRDCALRACEVTEPFRACIVASDAHEGSDTRADHRNRHFLQDADRRVFQDPPVAAAAAGGMRRALRLLHPRPRRHHP